MFGLGRKKEKEEDSIFLRAACISVGVNLAGQYASVFFKRQIEVHSIVVCGPTAGNATITVGFDDANYDGPVPGNEMYLVDAYENNAQTVTCIPAFRFPCTTNAMNPLTFPHPILTRRMTVASTQTTVSFFVNILYR